MAFASLVEERVSTIGVGVCLGIDPRPVDHPLMGGGTAAAPGAPAPAASASEEVAERVTDFYRAVLRGAADHAACVKLQSAFFEAIGPAGASALAALIDQARSLGLPAIVDAKRGDVGSTAEAYAATYLGTGPLAGDALTVSPYLGFDALEPFVTAARDHGRGLFVLVVTSNPGAPALQDLVTGDGRRVHEHVADWIAALPTEPATPRGYGPVGAVVGATRPQRLRALRTRLPAAILLVPGFGAQGGGARDVVEAFDGDGHGALVSASRSLIPGSAHGDLASVEREAGRRTQAMARDLRTALEQRGR